MNEPSFLSIETRSVPQRPARRHLHVAAVTIILLVGGALRITQFAANPSLWLDEAAVARNIFDRPLVSLLTKPLAYDQSAPPGFLLAEKSATAVFGRADYALRVFPFLCSLAALLLFAYVAHRLLSVGGALVSMTLFSFAFPLIYFAAQAKQYSSDVLASVCLLACAYELRLATSTWRRVALAILGAMVPWFSQSGTFVALAVSAVVLLIPPAVEQAKKYRLRIAPAVAAWTVSSAAALMFALTIVPPGARDYLHRFWATGFLPSTLAGEMQTWWPLDQLRNFIGEGGPGGRISALAYPMPAIYLGVAVIGLYAIWRRDRAIACLIVGPPLLTLAAAVARQYPFSDRLILFLLPCFLLAVGGFTEWLKKVSGNGLVVDTVCVGVIGAAVPATVAKLPPYHNQPVKTLLKMVESERIEGDPVYVFYGAVPTVDLYVDQLGLDPTAYFAGRCHRGESRLYLRELDSFRGHSRVWLILTHALPQYRERDDILRYLDAIGTRRKQITLPSRMVAGGLIPSEAFLYDLGDPVRLQHAEAGTFSLNGPNRVAGRLGCNEGPAAITAGRLTWIERRDAR